MVVGHNYYVFLSTRHSHPIHLLEVRSHIGIKGKEATKSLGNNGVNKHNEPRNQRHLSRTSYVDL